jgi:hypothetical protein
MTQPETDQLHWMTEEHDAWKDACSELLRLLPAGADLDFAKYDPVVRSIQRWGERLVRVRRHQDDDTIDRAYRLADDGYTAAQVARDARNREKARDRAVR